MKGFEKERKHTPAPLWIKLRFYVLILFASIALIIILLLLNHGEKLPEVLIPAGISLVNALTAYIISKRKQGERSYKDMMKNVKNWTIARFLAMLLFLASMIILKLVDPLPFIFTFIGFYILHQLIVILIMQREIK